MRRKIRPVCAVMPNMSPQLPDSIQWYVTVGVMSGSSASTLATTVLTGALSGSDLPKNSQPKSGGWSLTSSMAIMTYAQEERAGVPSSKACTLI